MNIESKKRTIGGRSKLELGKKEEGWKKKVRNFANGKEIENLGTRLGTGIVRNAIL